MNARKKRLTAFATIGVMVLSQFSSTIAYAVPSSVELGTEVVFPNLYAQNGITDSECRTEKEYTEKHDKGSSNVGDLNALARGYGFDMSKWDWADGINSGSWKDPVNNQGQMGSPDNPGGTPDALNNPGKMHEDLKNAMPYNIPNTKEGMDELLRDLSGGKQTGVMSIDEWMKINGDQSDKIRQRYDALIAEAKKKQGDDVGSSGARQVFDAYNGAVNGKDPYGNTNGRGNNKFPTAQQILDGVGSEADDWAATTGTDGNGGGTNNDDGNGNGNGNGSTTVPKNGDSVDIPWDKLPVTAQEAFRLWVTNNAKAGYYDQQYFRHLSKDEKSKIHMVSDGYVVDGNGKPIRTIAEQTAMGLDDATYVYDDSDGKPHTIDASELLKKYDLDEAKQKLKNLRTVSDVLKNESKDGSVDGIKDAKVRKAIIDSGTTIKDGNGKTVTVDQAMKAAGNKVENMDRATREAFDQNPYLSAKMLGIYGTEQQIASQTQAMFKAFKNGGGFDDIVKNNPSSFKWEDMPADIRMAATLFWAGSGKSAEEVFNEMNNSPEKWLERGMQETEKYLDAAKASGGNSRQLYDPDEAKAALQKKYGTADLPYDDPNYWPENMSLRNDLVGTEGDFSKLPAETRKYMTESEFERLYELATDGAHDYMSYADVNWTDTPRVTEAGRSKSERDNTPADASYWDETSHDTFNNRNASGSGLMIDGTWMQESQKWKYTRRPFGQQYTTPLIGTPKVDKDGNVVTDELGNVIYEDMPLTADDLPSAIPIITQDNNVYDADGNIVEQHEDTTLFSLDLASGAQGLMSSIDAMRANISNSYVYSEIQKKLKGGNILDKWTGSSNALRQEAMSYFNTQSGEEAYVVVNSKTGVNTLNLGDSEIKGLSKDEKAYSLCDVVQIELPESMKWGDFKDFFSFYQNGTDAFTGDDPNSGDSGSGDVSTTLPSDEDMYQWILDNSGIDPNGGDKRNQSESDKQRQTYEQQSESMKKDNEDKIRRLEEQKQKALADYAKQLRKEYDEYLKRHPDKKDAFPKNSDQWTQADIDKAVEQLNNEPGQKADTKDGIPWVGPSPQIQDTPEFNEEDINAIIKDWPSDRSKWTQGMKDFVDALRKQLANDPEFAQTLADMIEAGVFDEDDPDAVRANILRYMNGYEKVGDGKVSDNVKIYTIATGNYYSKNSNTTGELKRGNPYYLVKCVEQGENVDDAYIRGGTGANAFSWTAGPVIGTYTWHGYCEEYHVTYTLTQCDVHFEMYPVYDGVKGKTIGSYDCTVVMEDESGINQENRGIVNAGNGGTIKVTAGNIDMDKRDFFDTMRVK